MSSGKHKRINILIVEDSPTQAEHLKLILERAGYEVRVAGNGKEALSLLETTLPKLVISDIVMPEMDGYELCRTIKQDTRFNLIPVILVTVLFDPHDVIRGLECGANNFIPKPYDEKYLLSRIEVVLASSYFEETEKFQIGLEISFAGKKHHINASRLQILNMLLSTYETAVQKNHELTEARDQLRELNEHLEDMVAERTLQIETTNRQLLEEIEIRKKTEEALKRKTRAHRVISECNQFLVRTSDEQDLTKGICKILVTEGGYRYAWVGYAHQDKDKTVEPVAQSGFEPGYLKNLQISWKKGHHGKGPTGTAIRTSKPMVVHNIPDNLKCRGWRSEAITRDYSTVAAFPLIIQEQVVGALTIYASEPEAFDADEQQLLSELTNDLAFGITSIRTTIERKQAEKVLVASEIRYRRFFESVRDGILILDAETGMIVDVNPFLIELLGFSHDQFLGKKLWEIGVFRDIAASKDNFKELQEKQYIIYEDLPLETADGRQIHSEFVSFVYEVEGKNVMQCNIRDITVRKKAEVALQQSERELKTLFIRMINAFVLFESVFDDDGNVVSFRFVFINDAYERITGVKNDEVLGKTMHEVWPGTEASWITAYGDVAVTGVPRSFEMYHDPTKKWYYCNVYRPGESRDRICVIFEDITERKKADNQIALANRKLALMTDVTYQDIQNKITAVRGFVELMRDAATDEQRHAFIEKEDEILENIHNLIKKTKDYQEMGVYESQWISLEEKIRLQASPITSIKNISLEINLHGLECYTDLRIDRVFYNLIDNAVKHAKTLTRISFYCRKMPAGIIVTCEDDGVGIPPNEKIRIFDRVVGGKGHFGLFFVREFLDMSGMKIAETGEPGKGARFEITVQEGMYRFTATSAPPEGNR